MSNQWSDNLRKRMESHREPSPEGLWEEIEAVMKEEGFIKTASKKPIISLRIKRTVAAAAVISAMLLAGNYLLNNKNPWELQVTSHKTNLLPEAENNSFPTPPDDEAGLIAENVPHNKKAIATPASRWSSLPEEQEISKEQESIIAGTEKNEEPENAPRKEDPQHGSGAETRRDNKQPASNIYDLQEYSHITVRRNTPAKWGTAVYASGVSMGSKNKQEGYKSFTPGESPQEEVPDEEPIPGVNPYSDILAGNKYREVYTDIKHRQPVTVGLSASYNFTKKWGITGGLTYTLLSSQLRAGSDSYYYVSEQTLHNVGILLNVNYNIWSNERFSVYLTGGGQVEKNVAGRLTTDYIVDNKRKNRMKDRISVDQLQWSLNTSAGVQYNLSPKTGLYAEPGLSYYLKNGSEVETIYKEKSVNFNIMLGFRFSLNK